jgi:DNA-binding NarL/FixJ family response regulator
LIVDDHAGFRGWARALLQGEGFDVVGEASDGASSVEAVRRLRPDVVLLDIRLPDMNGFQVAELLAEVEKPPAIVLTSSHDGRDYRKRVAASIAKGFVPKGDLSRESLEAVLKT